MGFVAVHVATDRPADDVGAQDRVKPARFATALRALIRCAFRCALLIVRRQIRQPRVVVGTRFTFANGTAATVYRETIIERSPARMPAMLEVCFRLRHVHSPLAHALFRWESELNTVLFAGFPGLISKLWFTQDERGLYRGLYEWDGPELAVSYVRSLWWVLALVSEPDSIDFHVVPGWRRADLAEDTLAPDQKCSPGSRQWWRVTGTSPSMPLHASAGDEAPGTGSDGAELLGPVGSIVP